MDDVLDRQLIHQTREVRGISKNIVTAGEKSHWDLDVGEVVGWRFRSIVVCNILFSVFLIKCQEMEGNMYILVLKKVVFPQNEHSTRKGLTILDESHQP
jgi:hypothetical protein